MPTLFSYKSANIVYTIYLSSLGYAYLTPISTGTSYAYLPVDLPSTLLGTPQKLKSIKVCYKVSNAASYITETDVYYANTSLNRTVLVSDGNNQTSTTPACYTITAPTPATIQGPVYIQFILYYSGTGSAHNISIGQVILTLTED